MAFPPISNIPVVLFPLKLETRFVSDELWIRAFPDMAFLQSHDPILSYEERADAALFKETAPEQKEEAWENLVNKYGVYRAAWIVQITPEELAAQEQAASEQGEKPGDEAASFYFKWLPDRLVFYLYKNDQRSPAYTAAGSLIDREGLTVLGEGDEWVQDFSKAVEVGMAIKIKINAGDTGFDKVIAGGIRYAEDPSVPAKGLAQLFHNHQYTEGFSFLKFGVPTNNTHTAKSGFSAKDEFDAPGSYAYAVEGLELETPGNDSPPTAGKKLAHSLGIEAATLRHARDADIREPELNELFQKASWFALGAQPLFLLFGDAISNETHLEIWEHYSRHVKAKGPYSALKIGNQPYGFLPIMNIRRPLEDEGEDIRNSDELFDQLWELSAHLLNRWLAMVKNNPQGIPKLEEGKDSYTEILKILSMQEYSSVFQIRALEYNGFQKKLFQWLRQLRDGGSLDSLFSTIYPNSLLHKDLLNVLSSRNSLVNLFPESAAEADRLLRSPFLSISEADADLIRFREGQAVITDQFGQPVVDENEEEIMQEADAFSLTQEDLGDFQDFIDKLESDNSSDFLTFQYRGDTSLFTDLFFRGYVNAAQLYHREIYYDFTTEDLRNFPKLEVGGIQEVEGAIVAKGQTILEIKRSRDGFEGSPIPVVAPFDGKIVKLRVSAGDPYSPGVPLFTLVNEAKRQEINAQFIELGRKIIAECNAIADPAARREAQAEAIREALDLNSYRLDAWITSLAARRIEEMRSRPEYAEGIYFGAYGWVEDLEKNTANPIDKATLTDIYTGEGGMIHAATPAQAVASAIFKNSFLSYKEIQAGNPFTLNLTSDRLQKSQALLEGIRQGQEMEALLGYQLERYLHEHPDGGLHNEIYILREAFPLYENITNAGGQTTGFIQLSVIDGLKAIQNKANLPTGITGATRTAVVQYIEKLEDILDGSLDALFYEAGYQVTQGNLSQAAAALDATKGEIEPPAIESLKTRIPGVGVAHKLIVGFSAPTTAHSLENCRAFAEPALEKWLEENIGDLNKIGCAVELIDIADDQPIETVDLSLADLQIGYLDLLYLSKDPVDESASELELRIWKKVTEQRQGISAEEIRYKITDPVTAGRQPLSRALEVAKSAYALLGKSRFLKSEDLYLDGETVQYARQTLDEIKTNRLAPILQRLKAISQSGLIEESNLAFLAKLDLEIAKAAFLGYAPFDAAQLKAAIEEKIAAAEAVLADFNSELSFYSAFEILQQTAKMLFGPDFLLLPPALGSDAFAGALQSPLQKRLVGEDSASTKDQAWGQERIENWVQGLAQIYENTELFEDWLMVRKIWDQAMGLNKNLSFRIVQGPTLLQYPWLALSKQEIDRLLQTQHKEEEIYKNPASGEPYPLSDGTYYPDGCDSAVVYAQADFKLEKDGVKTPVFGLVIEEFSDHIPNEKVDTGLSFHYNAPNNEPPQAILLAVHPKAAMTQNFAWSENDLRDIIFDTMDLYKARMVDTDAMQEYGYALPMTYWLNIPRSL
jgi:hypothetical protein